MARRTEEEKAARAADKAETKRTGFRSEAFENFFQQAGRQAAGKKSREEHEEAETLAEMQASKLRTQLTLEIAGKQKVAGSVENFLKIVQGDPKLQKLIDAAGFSADQIVGQIQREGPVTPNNQLPPEPISREQIIQGMNPENLTEIAPLFGGPAFMSMLANLVGQPGSAMTAATADVIGDRLGRDAAFTRQVTGQATGVDAGPDIAEKARQDAIADVGEAFQELTGKASINKDFDYMLTMVDALGPIKAAQGNKLMDFQIDAMDALIKSRIASANHMINLVETSTGLKLDVKTDQIVRLQNAARDSITKGLPDVEVLTQNPNGKGATFTTTKDYSKLQSQLDTFGFKKVEKVTAKDEYSTFEEGLELLVVEKTFQSILTGRAFLGIEEGDQRPTDGTIPGGANLVPAGFLTDDVMAEIRALSGLAPVNPVE